MSAWLFVPADRPERFDKALASGADRVVLDLEDGVAAPAKERARQAVRDWLQPRRRAVLRVNAPGTEAFVADLALAALPGVDGVILPKAERPADLTCVAAAGATVLWPLVETAAGFAALETLARARGVRQLVFGSLDLQADLGMDGASEDELLPWRAQLVQASRLAGLEPPVDGVTVALDDAARLEADVARARRLGFGGKLCIHPRQVAAVQRGFRPSEAQCAWARAVLAAAAQAGGGAVAFEGHMVDAPVLRRAQLLLQRAAQADGADGGRR